MASNPGVQTALLPARGPIAGLAGCRSAGTGDGCICTGLADEVLAIHRRADATAKAHANGFHSDPRCGLELCDRSLQLTFK